VDPKSPHVFRVEQQLRPGICAQIKSKSKVVSNVQCVIVSQPYALTPIPGSVDIQDRKGLNPTKVSRRALFGGRCPHELPDPRP
jgi:hypothetical protein